MLSKLSVKKLLTVIVLIAVVLGIGLGVIYPSIYHRATAEVVSGQVFKMKSGASLRIQPNHMKGRGLRFSAVISKKTFDEFNDKQVYKSVTYGMIFMPKSYCLKAQELGKDINDRSLYGFSRTEAEKEEVLFFVSTSDILFEGKLKVPYVESTPVSVVDAGGQKCYSFNTNQEVANLSHYEMWGSVVNIKDGNLGLEYTAQAYVKLVSAMDNSVRYLFADLAESEGRFRSPLELANKALATGMYSSDEKVTAFLEDFQTTYDQVKKGIK